MILAQFLRLNSRRYSNNSTVKKKTFFFICNKSGDKGAGGSPNGERTSPRAVYKHASPRDLLVLCRPLRKEYARSMKVPILHLSGTTAVESWFRSANVRGKKVYEMRTGEHRPLNGEDEISVSCGNYDG